MSGGWLLWLGPIFDQATLHAGYAVSPAANRWQEALVRALEARGRHVRVVSYMLSSAWPKGRLYIRDAAGRMPDGIDGCNIGYSNVPFARGAWLAARHIDTLRQLIAKHGSPAAIINYNELPGPWSAALVAVVKGRLPWVNVIADATQRGFASIARAVRSVKSPGRVYLSWADYQADTRARKLHLDGAADCMRPYVAPTLPKRVVYTGSQSTSAGAELLAQAFARVTAPDVELVVSGVGKHQALIDLAARDRRVRLRGLVSENELIDICTTATVFVNPRLPSAPENINNFPSKLLEYLSFGRPVVSTWTAGLAPEYADVLTIADASPEPFAACIELALAASQHDAYAKAHRFIEGSRTWKAQAARLDAWLGELPAP